MPGCSCRRSTTRSTPTSTPGCNQAIFLIGAHMAGDLADAGKRGVLTNAMYDNWWNGGNRTTPQRHNIVAVLTEAASVRLASPIFLDKDELRGGARGFTELPAGRQLRRPLAGGLVAAPRHRRLRADLRRVAPDPRRALPRPFQSQPAWPWPATRSSKGAATPPFAWVVPADQRDPGTAAEMVRILHDTGIEVQQRREFVPGRRARLSRPGLWILPAAQPYRAHLKDMMERQVYPNRLTAGGEAEPPYDVAGWTLPLQMGVRVVEVQAEFSPKAQKLDIIEPIAGKVDLAPGESGEPATYRIDNRANDDFIVRDALVDAGVEVQLITRADDGNVGAIVFPAGERRAMS